MQDEFLDEGWHLDIEFDESDTHTHATVRAHLGDDETLTAIGDAFRNPRDLSQPMIGEEIAAARALISLGHRPAAPRRVTDRGRHPAPGPPDQLRDQAAGLAAVTVVTGVSLVSAFICSNSSR